MQPTTEEIDLVFARTQKSDEILRGLYELNRSYTRKFSFRYLCQRLGSNSKGHISYMMEGKRRIPQKYWVPFFQIFKLNDEQIERWQTILEAESSRGRARMVRTETNIRSAALTVESPAVIQSCAGYSTWY